MVLTVLKVILIVLLCSNDISAEPEKTSDVGSKQSPTTLATPTTTTPTRTDSTKDVTDQVEASAQLDARQLDPHESLIPQQLDPHESRQQTKAQDYTKRRGVPGSQKTRYEDHAVEYARDEPDEDFYKNSEEAAYRPQKPRQRPRHHVEYAESFEVPYEPPRHRNHDHSYEEQQQPPDKERPRYSNKREPGPYAYQDYSREESYESREVGRDRGYQHGYEGARKKPQQDAFDPLDVPDSDADSRYGLEGTKVRPPPAYYPRPKSKPKRYQTENHNDGGYGSGRHREGSYFHAVPKEAGYAPDDQREPDYLQAPPRKPPPYLQHAGYAQPHHHHHHHRPAQKNPDTDHPRQQKRGPQKQQQEPRHHNDAPPDSGYHHLVKQHDPPSDLGYHHLAKQQHDPPETGYLIKQHEDILQILQKKSERSPDGGKVSIHIKHLGYSALPGLQQRGKGKQGFLLLPIVSDGGDQGKQYLGGHKPEFEDERGRGNRPRIVHEKELFYQREVPTSKHALEPPAAVPQDYERPPLKSLQHPDFGNFRPIPKQTFYENSEYEVPRPIHLQGYSEEVSQEGHPHVVPKALTPPYAERHQLRTLPRPHLAYEGPQGVIPSFAAGVKYEPGALYDGKPPRYESPYDVTRAFRSLPSKARDHHPSFYSSLPRFAESPKPGGDYPAFVQSRPRRKNSETSLLYSAQYRNVANRLAAEYGRTKSEPIEGRRPAEFAQQKPAGRELEDYRPTAYQYRKTLGDLGLQHYESVLGQPKNGRTAVGALYYDLAPHSANQDVAQISADQSDSKGGSPNIEIFV